MELSAKQKPDLSKKIHDVPHKPGVYLMRDRFNRVIYVGKARDLRKRVSSYFLPSKLAVADLKTRAMLDSVWDFETYTVRSEAESVLLEGKLIKEYRPGSPDSRKMMGRVISGLTPMLARYGRRSASCARNLACSLLAAAHRANVN